MFEPYKYKKVVSTNHELSVADVYGTPDPHVPARKVAVAFRPPKMGEVYLSPGVMKDVSASMDRDEWEPRIILEDKPKRRFLVFRYEIVPDGQNASGMGKITERAAKRYIGDADYPFVTVEEED